MNLQSIIEPWSLILIHICSNVLQVLARGHFATVFQGKYKGSVVAVKMYPASWRHIFITEKEIYELLLMRHNGIAQFLGTEWKPDDNSWLIVLQHAKYVSLKKNPLKAEYMIF